MAPRETEPLGLGPARRLGYRYQWWTIAGTDAYLALRLEGQCIYIDPFTATVVVKLSYFSSGNDEVEVESQDFLRMQWTP